MKFTNPKHSIPSEGDVDETRDKGHKALLLLPHLFLDYYPSPQINPVKPSPSLFSHSSGRSSAFSAELRRLVASPCQRSKPLSFSSAPPLPPFPGFLSLLPPLALPIANAPYPSPGPTSGSLASRLGHYPPIPPQIHPQRPIPARPLTICQPRRPVKPLGRLMELH